jgi:acyl-CoA synthetase (AMP-forming)/AMP-acid ligase II
VAKTAGISSNKIYVLGKEAKGQKTFSGLIDGARTKNMKPVDVRPAGKNTLAFLIFSSGTTGRPKGWCLSLFRLLLIPFLFIPDSGYDISRQHHIQRHANYGSGESSRSGKAGMFSTPN